MIHSQPLETRHQIRVDGSELIGSEPIGSVDLIYCNWRNLNLMWQTLQGERALYPDEADLYLDAICSLQDWITMGIGNPSLLKHNDVGIPEYSKLSALQRIDRLFWVSSLLVNSEIPAPEATVLLDSLVCVPLIEILSSILHEVAEQVRRKASAPYTNYRYKAMRAFVRHPEALNTLSQDFQEIIGKYKRPPSEDQIKAKIQKESSFPLSLECKTRRKWVNLIIFFAEQLRVDWMFAPSPYIDFLQRKEPVEMTIGDFEIELEDAYYHYNQHLQQEYQETGKLLDEQILQGTPIGPGDSRDHQAVHLIRWMQKFPFSESHRQGIIDRCEQLDLKRVNQLREIDSLRDKALKQVKAIR